MVELLKIILIYREVLCSFGTRNEIRFGRMGKRGLLESKRLRIFMRRLDGMGCLLDSKKIRMFSD